MQLTTFLVALSGLLTAAIAADTCQGAYFVDLVPAPADCTRRTMRNDTLTVDLKFYFPNGTTLYDSADNSTGKGGPLVFNNTKPSPTESLIGLDQGLQDMCAGEKRWIMVPPEFGFGSKGVGDGSIPPNSTLIFELQVDKIERNATTGVTVHKLLSTLF